MGYCCSKRNNEDEEVKQGGTENAAPHPLLENFNRWRTFSLPHRGFLCGYDFQDRTAQLIQPVFDLPLIDYAHIYIWPLIYVAGGVDEPTGEPSNKVWTSSANEVCARFSEIAPMGTARKKPFLICPRTGIVYAVSGWSRFGQLRTCEKFAEGGGAWRQADSLSIEPTEVFAVSTGCIYAFSRIKDKAIMERMDATEDFPHWEQITLSIAGGEAVDLTGRYGVAAGGEDAVFIFGGIDGAGKASRAIYMLDAVSGTVARVKRKLGQDAVMTECATDSGIGAYYVTKELRLCVYNKRTTRWTFEETDIANVIKRKELA